MTVRITIRRVGAGERNRVEAFLTGLLWPCVQTLQEIKLCLHVYNYDHCPSCSHRIPSEHEVLKPVDVEAYFYSNFASAKHITVKGYMEISA